MAIIKKHIRNNIKHIDIVNKIWEEHYIYEYTFFGLPMYRHDYKSTQDITKDSDPKIGFNK